MTNASEKPAQTRLRRAWPRLLGLAIWLGLLAAYWQYTRSSGITPLESVQRLVAFMASSGAGILDQSADSGVLQSYADRMRRNSFETVLIMRFIFLPYDLVSYFSGFLRIRWQGFLLATALGSIPGTIAFVLFGASIEGGFTGELPQLNDTMLAVGALMFVVSLGLSRWFRRREAKRAGAAVPAAIEVEA